MTRFRVRRLQSGFFQAEYRVLWFFWLAMISGPWNLPSQFSSASDAEAAIRAWAQRCQAAGVVKEFDA